MTWLFLSPPRNLLKTICYFVNLKKFCNRLGAYLAHYDLYVATNNVQENSLETLDYKKRKRHPCMFNWWNCQFIELSSKWKNGG